MIQQEFALQAKKIWSKEENVIGLAVGGSWLADEIDEFSDLDLILVTRNKVSDDRDQMFAYAKSLGNYLSGFTGEHVGEPRLLICLYDNPLLHVDIKFLTLEEFNDRVENPHLLLDKEGQLQKALDNSEAHFPMPDYQWIEDRFWTWIHYALLKIGRGEYFEAFDFLGFLRMLVLGPLLHMKNGNLPRAVRKVEMDLDSQDLEALKASIPSYDRQSLLDSFRQAITLYRQLRNTLFDESIRQHKVTEKKVLEYFDEIEQRK